MTHEEAFLRDILEHPDDDGRRLIFADWLEDNGDRDRAEFIRIQILREHDRARAGKGYLDRAVALFEANWSRWVMPLARLIGPEPSEMWLQAKPPLVVAPVVDRFRRGLLESVTMTCRLFVSHGERVLDLAPLTGLRLRMPGGVCQAVAEQPGLRWIRRLDFLDSIRAPVQAADMAALADSPHLGRLCDLSLAGHDLTNSGLAELLRAWWAPQLTYLDLADNGLSGAAVVSLIQCDRLPNLRNLRLDRNQVRLADLAPLRERPLDRLLAVSVRGTSVSSQEAFEFTRSDNRLVIQANSN